MSVSYTHLDVYKRQKETYDGALPSGNAVMAYNLVRLSQLTGDARWEEAARRQLDWLSEVASAYPSGHAMFLLALLVDRNPPPRVTVVLACDADRAAVTAGLPLYADVAVLDRPTQPVSYTHLNGSSPIPGSCVPQCCFIRLQSTACLCF